LIQEIPNTGKKPARSWKKLTLSFIKSGEGATSVSSRLSVPSGAKLRENFVAILSQKSRTNVANVFYNSIRKMLGQGLSPLRSEARRWGLSL